jgi:hypothetical protein
MKFAMSKYPPLNVRLYGSVASPAGPTTAPIGSDAAADSVAGTGVVAAVEVVLDVPAVVPPVEGVVDPVVPVEGVGEVPAGAAVELEAAEAVGVLAAEVPLPADPASPPSSIERKST